MSNKPFQFIVEPFDIYLAPVGEAFPAIEDAPAGNWAKLGASGKDDYSEEGVQLTLGQAVSRVGSYGSTLPRKYVRTEESIEVTVNVMDLQLEQLTKVIANAAVTDTAAGGGNAGFREIDLERGFSMAEFAMLIRGEASAYGDGWNTQVQIPRAVHINGSMQVSLLKSAPAGWPVQFAALKDEAGGKVKIIMQDAAPV